MFKEIDYFDGSIKLIGTHYPLNDAPLLILFPAFEGPSEFCHNYAQKLLQNGFSVFIADMYGSKKVETSIDGAMKEITPFLNSRSLVRKRALAAYNACLTHLNARENKMGAFGFCFGGMCALEILRAGVPLKACASVHGVVKKSELPTHKIVSHLLVLSGYLDPQVPKESVFELAHELEEAHCKDWQLHFFGQAKHSFTDPKTGTFDPKLEKEMGREYNKKAAETAFDYLTHFFKKELF